MRLDSITKRYDHDSAPAVAAVDLTIEDGEFMVLLGPSGCGKSTTLRMIAGLETITEGTLAIDGRVMNRVPAKDRDIAMVFQSYALYPHMSVHDNMAFGLRRRGFPRAEIERRVREAAALLGLAELLHRRPFALSGGQRQRVALGRAIVRDPKVFLFDEPLSNLDAALRVSTRNELIKQHHRLGATMIYVTHDQVEAMTMGSRICIMNDGRVVQVGRPLDVYQKPVDTFVASFLGNPPTNLLPVRIDGDGCGPVALLGETSVPLPHFAPVLAERDGHATLGIRPEDLYEDAPPGGGFAVPLPASVLAVEPLGAETLLVVRLPATGDEITARLGRTCKARPGDALTLWLDARAVHLFDAETGRAIVPAH